MNPFQKLVLGAARPVAMPLALYPGLALTGARVHDVVNDPEAQFQAQAALHARYQTPCLLSAMDLSVEAEAFGCPLHLAEDEIPSVTGRLVTCLEEAADLAIPEPGAKRTDVYIRTVGMLRARFPDRLVLAGCIGPFSLAARLVGMSEAMELTMTDPDLVQAVLAKCSNFLVKYLQAFQAAGADGVIMAEPAAGLLSPRSMAVFSSSAVREIAATVQEDRFAIILHNCAAKLVHLPALLESGLHSFHFGAPMDLPAALAKVPADVVLCGNLDPTAVFLNLSPSDLRSRVRELLAAAQGRRNFVLSSGCDVPARVPLANLDAFFQQAGET